MFFRKSPPSGISGAQLAAPERFARKKPPSPIELKKFHLEHLLFMALFNKVTPDKTWEEVIRFLKSNKDLVNHAAIDPDIDSNALEIATQLKKQSAIEALKKLGGEVRDECKSVLNKKPTLERESSDSNSDELEYTSDDDESTSSSDSDYSQDDHFIFHMSP